MRSLIIAGMMLSFASGLGAAAQDIEETKRLAVIHYPSLKQARIEIDLAKEGLVSARSARGVQVSLALSSAIQSIGTDRAFAIDTGETFLNSAQIEAVLPLYTSGELEASIEQARLLVDASDAAYHSAEQTILLAAISAHLDVAETAEAVRIREQNVARLKKQLDATRDRFDVGVLTRTDIALAEARYQASVAGQLSALATHEAALARYEELTGLRPTNLMMPDHSDEPFAPVSDLLDRLRSGNFDLVQLALLERVAGLGIEVARSQKKLKVEAFGNAGIQDGSWNNNFQDTSATMGVRASRPLYASGAFESAERQAIQRAERAKLQTVLVQNDLLRRLSSAIAEHKAARSAILASEKEVEAARTALEGAEIEVSVGLRTTLDLLDQEQDLLEAELRLIAAKKNVYLSLSQIEAFLGDLSVSSAAN